MRCSKCGAAATEPVKFCSSCGAKFEPVPEPVAAGEDGLYFCYKHKKETTRVSCGRCERPICTKCTVIGSAGVRCRECAKHRVPVHMRGVVHDITKGATSSPMAQRVWYMVIFAFVINLFSGLFGGNRRL